MGQNVIEAKKAANTFKYADELNGYLDELEEADEASDSTKKSAAEAKIAALATKMEDISELNSEVSADKPTVVEIPADCTSDTSCEYICNSFVKPYGVPDDALNMADTLTKDVTKKVTDASR